MADIDNKGTAILDGQADARKPEGTLNASIDQQDFSEDRWTDSYAKRVVVQEYDEVSQYRKQNHDPRWDEAEKLYLAEYPQQVWPGTRIPRSSISVPIAFEQIESMKPRMVGGIFSEDKWFECEGQYGTTPKIANNIGNTLYDQFSFSNPHEVVRRGISSALCYGNGIVELYWDRHTEARTQFTPKFSQKKKTIVDPLTGQRFQQPTGEYTMKMVDQKIEQLINRPAMKYLSVRDFFIDPHAPSPVVKEARFVQKRVMVSIQDVVDLGQDNGFNVPSVAELTWILNNVQDYDPSDQSRQNANAYNRVSLNPTIEYTKDGRIGRVEVIMRWSNDRLIWVVGKALTIYNHPNPFGFIPFYNIFYVDLIDRFYGLSVADVVEGEQRFQGKLINTRSDELSLALDPPTVVQGTGGRISTFELRYRPGNLAHVQNAQEDVQRQFPKNYTAQAFVEQQQSDIRVQRITGQNESIMQGVPTAQNPIARSATGANMQAAASMSRLIYTVENIETLVLEPLVADAWELNKRYLDPSEMIAIAKSYQADPSEMFNGFVSTHVRAGSKMASKQIMAQMFPLVMQALGNGAVLSQLAMQGQTVDWQEMFRILFDAAGYTRKATIIRQMNGQEKQQFQQAQQQQQQDAQMKMQMQRERLTSIADMQQDKGTMDFVTQIAKIMLQNKQEGRPIDSGLQGLLQQAAGGMGGSDIQGGGSQGVQQQQLPPQAGQQSIISPGGQGGGGVGGGFGE